MYIFCCFRFLRFGNSNRPLTLYVYVFRPAIHIREIEIESKFSMDLGVLTFGNSLRSGGTGVPGFGVTGRPLNNNRPV